MKTRVPMVDLPHLPAHVVERAVARALEEDLGEVGDLTSDAAVPANAMLKGSVRARAAGRVAGAEIARAVFRAVDPAITVEVKESDGEDVASLDAILAVRGPARAILAGERVALNFLGRLSGIATLTAHYVAAIDGTMARVVGTRKTTPGLRALELHAIRCGGGGTHRFGLNDAILVKDNHVAIAGGVGPALVAVRAKAGHMVHVSVEIDRMEQLEEALRYSPDVVLLDNFKITEIAEAVRIVGARCTVEASGGVTLDNVRAIAETGVDVISVGALTHSAPALDLGLDAE